jgi:hypothetical protein
MTDVQSFTPVQVPARVGQATAVEQSRAATEVLASVQAALMFPRDVQRSLTEMRQSCSTEYMAQRAFYSYRRGGENVAGPTVQLARELARCWGNVHYGVAELSRDDVAGQSEMQAWAWDVQTNERVSSTFIVPHGRDTKTGVKPIEDLRSIYENNANAAARRLREMIYALLPVWFRAEAEEICRRTMQGGGTMTREQKIAFYLEAFARKSVSQRQVEAYIGRPADAWVVGDIDTLQVVFNEIKDGVKLISDVFGAEPLRDADVTAPAVRGQSWPVQGYGAPDAGTSQPLPESATWPVTAQIPGGTGRRRSVQEGEPQDVPPIDDYEGGE